jgi:DNA-binding MarR family transcriptional regulator
MEALDLIVLGRQLTRIGEEAMRGGQAPPLPTGQSLVLRDVLTNPGSSITEITARTGLPQSYVSESVGRLRDRGLVETELDAADGRRTLVTVNREHASTVARRGSIDVDAPLARALGETDTHTARPLLEALQTAADRLAPSDPGPVLRQIRPPRR